MAKVIDPFNDPFPEDNQPPREQLEVDAEAEGMSEADLQAAANFANEMLASFGLGGEDTALQGFGEAIAADLLEAPPLGLMFTKLAPLSISDVVARIGAALRGRAHEYIGARGNPAGTAVHRFEAEGHPYLLFVNNPDAGEPTADFDAIWAQGFLDRTEYFVLCWPGEDAEERLGGTVSDEDLDADAVVIEARSNVSLAVLRQFHTEDTEGLVDCQFFAEVEDLAEIDDIFAAENPAALLEKITNELAEASEPEEDLFAGDDDDYDDDYDEDDEEYEDDDDEYEDEDEDDDEAEEVEDDDEDKDRRP